MLIYNWPLCSRILKGWFYQHGISCHGNDSRSPLPHHHKNIRIKGYFDLIPNITQFVQNAYIITSKAQKFQILHDCQNYF